MSGWKLVPEVDPTPEMLDALHDTVRIECRVPEEEAEILNDRETYRAMIAAAPNLVVGLNDSEKRRRNAEWLHQHQQLIDSHAAKALAYADARHCGDPIDADRALAQMQGVATGLYHHYRTSLECADPPRRQPDAVVAAAKALVARLDMIEADDRYQSVWLHAYNHGLPYTGPTYEAELQALRAALDE